MTHRGRAYCRLLERIDRAYARVQLLLLLAGLAPPPRDVPPCRTTRS